MRRAPARPLTPGLAGLARDGAQQARDQRIGHLEDGGRARGVGCARRDLQMPRQAEHQRVGGQQLELAMVAGPVVLDEARQRFPADEHGEGVAPRRLGARPTEQDRVFGLVEVFRRRELCQVRTHQRPQRLGAQRLQEREADQLGQVLTPFAQRGDAQPRGRVETHVQIGAKTSRVHQRLDVFVRRRDELGRRRPRSRVAEAGDRAAFEHQQQLPLQLEIQVRDLVEKQRPAVRLLEHACMILDGARVGAASRAEEVRPQQRRWHGRQIGHDQRTLGPRARMDDLLGEEALAGPCFALDQQGQRRAGQRVELAAQLGHRGGASPEDAPFLSGVVNGERARDLGGQAPAVDHLVLAQIDQRIGGPLRAQVRPGGRQHDDRKRRIAGAQLLQNQQTLLAAQTVECRLPRLRVIGQRRLVFGQQLLLRQREVQVEDHQVGQRREAGQRLRRLAVVVRAAQRAAALALLADLTGDALIAARDGVELRKLAMDHLHGLIAIIDDE